MKALLHKFFAWLCEITDALEGIDGYEIVFNANGDLKVDEMRAMTFCRVDDDDGSWWLELAITDNHYLKVRPHQIKQAIRAARKM